MRSGVRHACVLQLASWKLMLSAHEDNFGSTAAYRLIRLLQRQLRACEVGTAWAQREHSVSTAWAQREHSMSTA